MHCVIYTWTDQWRLKFSSSKSTIAYVNVLNDKFNQVVGGNDGMAFSCQKNDHEWVNWLILWCIFLETPGKVNCAPNSTSAPLPESPSGSSYGESYRLEEIKKEMSWDSSRRYKLYYIVVILPKPDETSCFLMRCGGMRRTRWVWHQFIKQVRLFTGSDASQCSLVYPSGWLRSKISTLINIVFPWPL